MFRLDKWDQAFWNWMDHLPNLDTLERKQSEPEDISDPAPEATEEHRTGTRTVRWKARLLKLTTGAATVWGRGYPHPYHFVVAFLAALPWLALALVRQSGGLINTVFTGDDKHPNVASALFYPGLILTPRGVIDINVLGWGASAVVAL